MAYSDASQNGEPEAPSFEVIDAFQRHFLDDLGKLGTKFADTFVLSARNKNRKYKFSDGAELPMEALPYHDQHDNPILHRVVELVSKPGTRDDLMAAVTAIIGYLVSGNEQMIGEEDRDCYNVLDMAVQVPNAMGLIKTICEEGLVHTIENGKTPRPRLSESPTDAPVEPRKIDIGQGKAIAVYVEWEDLLNPGRDSCLHLAIKKNQEGYAKYLLDWIALMGAEEAVIGHCGLDGLTPLHLAVDFRDCSDARVDLASHIIDRYPAALSITSATMQRAVQQEGTKTKAHHSMSSRALRTQSKGGRIKEALAPYKYFLETANGAPNKHPQRPNGPQDKPGKAAEEMKNLLRLSCMRYHGQDRALITKLLDTTKQIHLDLNHRTQVTPGLLKYMAKMNFEPYLQYVYIPNLSVIDVKNEQLEATDWWDSHSRKNYAYIFWWLEKTKTVQRIFSIVVVDDPSNPHSDEVIEHAAKPFDVEEWDWRKQDICSDTLVAAAKNVRDLTLYWSGNRAVLKSWAAEDGLALLPKLKTVRIMAPESMESTKRTEETRENFETGLQKSWLKNWKGERPAPKATIKPLTSHAQLSDTKQREREEKEKWLSCTEEFVQTLKRYMNNLESKKAIGPNALIKVAIVDDGVDADENDIGKNIEKGETFFDNKGHWPGFYQSTHGHGHEMACLIRQLCPNVRLYIAKLNELWVDREFQITAESAAKAIDWAREQEVDIISMSWTIEDPAESALGDLQKAISTALNAGILMFCASNDQGDQKVEPPYPARLDKERIFRIGSATALGKLDEKTESNVMFIAPGGSDDEHQHQPHQAGSLNAASGNDPGAASHRRGSSIATARCAGLAALILQCVMLRHPTCDKAGVRKPGIMRGMFERLTKEKEEDAVGKYLRVRGVFEGARQSAQLGMNLERDIVYNVANDFVHTIPLKEAQALGLRSDGRGSVNGS